MPAHKRVSTEAVVAAYRETGSVWKAASKLGVCGQSIYERLRAIDHPISSRKWTADEVEELKRLIENSTLSEVASQLGRPYAGVACMASRLGIATRYGNRVKRKVPRGSGLTKPVVTRLVGELKAWAGSIRQFCRSRGLSIDVFALAVQKYEPETWRLLAWQRGLDEKVCPECGATFYPMTKKQIACSRRCTASHKRNREYFGGRRQEAIGLREGICQLCLQPRPSLAAHHVIGKENDPNNDLLVALCHGCHKLVTLAATRKFLDNGSGWERLAEFVLARRLAEQESGYAGTQVSVEVEYLTESELVDLNVLPDEERTASA